LSYSVDANILLYASDEQSPFHVRAREFLATCAGQTEVWYLAWITVMAYLRIATHPAIFASPLPPGEAQENVGELLSLPHVRTLSEQEGFWQLYRETSQDLVVRGNLVPDAHLATLLRQHGIRVLYTSDADFRRFRFLDVRNPLAG